MAFQPVMNEGGLEPRNALRRRNLKARGRSRSVRQAGFRWVATQERAGTSAKAQVSGRNAGEHAVPIFRARYARLVTAAPGPAARFGSDSVPRDVLDKCRGQSVREQLGDPVARVLQLVELVRGVLGTPTWSNVPSAIARST